MVLRAAPAIGTCLRIRVKFRICRSYRPCPKTKSFLVNPTLFSAEVSGWIKELSIRHCRKIVRTC